MTIFLTTHYMEGGRELRLRRDHRRRPDRGAGHALRAGSSGTAVSIFTSIRRTSRRWSATLSRKKLSWVRAAERIDVRLDNTVDALPILQDVKDWMESFEVFHGTMDDVFLNITGKEIRE